jgi:4-amino-4-deoxy-L-arabinose transferase-like glycosyltransferase
MADPRRDTQMRRDVSGAQGPSADAYSAPAGRHGGWALLVVLVLGFLIIECFVPMRTAVQIGADEGFELAKATLCVQGHHLYTEVWNDQPPLHTFLVTQVLKHVSGSVLGPRLVTVAFSAMLLVGVFLIVRSVNGAFVALLTVAMVIGSPGFVELSSSCMLEIPALATAVAALAILCIRRDGGFIWQIAAGLLFGLALLMKLVPLIYLPVAALLMIGPTWETSNVIRASTLRWVVFGLGLIAGFVGSDWIIEHGAYLTHFRQSWASHFGATKVSEYGSPRDHPYDWSVLLKNWDVTIPAPVGLLVIMPRLRTALLGFGGPPSGMDDARGTTIRLGLEALPLVWLALTFGVFGIHRPWWAYYYLHTALPLCWCAGVGINFLLETVKQRLRLRRTRSQRRLPSWGLRLMAGTIALFGMCGLGWMGARVYLQVANLRVGPKIQSTPVIAQMQRFRPFAEWLYADKLVYSFHTGIPVVPSLAVMPIKRLWSGDLDNAGIRRELERYKPGVIVLLNDGRDVPFKDLLDADYQMVYMDSDNRMYAQRKIVGKAQLDEVQ